MRIVFASLMVLVICGEAFSQSFFARRINRILTASGGIGISHYYGDIRDPGSFGKEMKYNLDAGIQYNFHHTFAARANLTYFALRGADSVAAYPNRNLSFKSWNLQFTVSGVVHLFPEGNRFYQRRLYNAYLYGGGGLVYFNPRAVAPDQYNGTALEEAGQTVSLRNLKTENVAYSPITPVILGGVGFKYSIDTYFDIMIEGAYHLTFSDYLDDVSTRYPDPADLESTLAAAMSNRSEEAGYDYGSPGAVRGNPDRNDGYFLVALKLEYYLPYNESQVRRAFRKRRPRGR